jgi:hypothetical protein
MAHFQATAPPTGTEPFPHPPRPARGREPSLTRTAAAHLRVVAAREAWLTRSPRRQAPESVAL